MDGIVLTINGQEVSGKPGQTVLDVCKDSGIQIPTLCHYKGLTDIGACRLCVVEIEKERRPVPACTYIIRDGLNIQTHTEKLEKYRRQVLELLFAERNHLCPFCISSGDCELQSLAYSYQMDNIRYELSWPSLNVDSKHDFLVFDHNRCILCGRCVRICDEIVGAHTLDFAYRGWKEMVAADLNQPLATSSCIACGACLQVCPTGAVSTKLNPYRGRPDGCTRVASICTVCGAGCLEEALVKDNTIIRIDSPDITGLRGLLCYRGRFEQINGHHDRIITPLIRTKENTFKPCSMDQALDHIADKFNKIRKQYGTDSIAGIASSKASNEALKMFKGLITYTIGSPLIDTFDGDEYRVIHQGITNFLNRAGMDIEADLEDILNADCVLIAGADPIRSHPIVGSYILRTVKNNNAHIIVLDPDRNPFPLQTSVWLRPNKGQEELTANLVTKAIVDKGYAQDSTHAKTIAKSLANLNVSKSIEQAEIDADILYRAAELLGQSRECIIIYGEDVSKSRNPALVTSLLNLSTISCSLPIGKAKIISLKPGGNSRGAWEMGLADSQNSILDNLNNTVKAAYLLISGDYIDDPRLLERIKHTELIITQASYYSPFTTIASVVLPSPLATERDGTFTTMDGKTRSYSRIVNPPDTVWQDCDVIQELAKRVEK